MFQIVKGFHDIYGQDIEYWEKLENILKNLYKTYGFKEFRLPILEKTSVFKRGIGETTDIVEKEMFTFTDADGEIISLRPEGTASLIRAYIENGLNNPPGIKKFFYMGSMFRRERPQKGRFRQFTQSGVEVVGCDSPLLDAEIISLLFNAGKAAGIEDFINMEINSIGCSDCRPVYRKELLSYFNGYKDSLCPDCLKRLDRNPLRILDCKKEKCREICVNAPNILEFLCDNCKNHFEILQTYLEKFNTPYKINCRMVRGLDYYVRTAFELVTDKLGAASAVGAGGRYNGLVKLMGGGDIPGIGFAIGMDRMVSLMKEKFNIDERKTDVYVIFFKGKSEDIGLTLVKNLRNTGITAEYDYDISSIKSQLKKANRSGALLTIILGENEIENGKASVKNMNNGVQSEEDLETLKDKIQVLLNKNI